MDTKWPGIQPRDNYIPLAVCPAFLLPSGVFRPGKRSGIMVSITEDWLPYAAKYP